MLASKCQLFPKRLQAKCQDKCRDPVENCRTTKITSISHRSVFCDRPDSKGACRCLAFPTYNETSNSMPFTNATQSEIYSIINFHSILNLVSNHCDLTCSTLHSNLKCRGGVRSTLLCHMRFELWTTSYCTLMGGGYVWGLGAYAWDAPACKSAILLAQRKWQKSMQCS